MNERFIGINGFTKDQLKIVKKVIKAYEKFNLLSDLRKKDHGYKFKITDERFELFSHELSCSFIEAGLI